MNVNFKIRPMTKIDLKKEDPNYYKAKLKAELREFEPYQYISIKGVGAPESVHFQESIPAIYAAAYAIKKQSQTLGRDFVVPKMEGQWWVKEGADFESTPRDDWHWKILIRLPEFVTKEMALHAFDYIAETKQLNQSKALQFETIHEGLCIQIMHIGSYDEEQESIAKIIAFMNEKQMSFNGYHHEIYLSDPRKTPVEKLKTILRYPIR